METVRLALSKLVSQFEFLKKRGGDYVEETLASKEFHELLEAKPELILVATRPL